MKICLINKTYSNPTWDGISAYTHNIAKGISSLGNEVHIITLRGVSYVPEEKKIHIYYLKNYGRKITPIIYGFQALLTFQKINREHQIDIVEAPDAGAEGFWISLFYPQKLVTRLHMPLYYYWKLNNMPFNCFRRILDWMEKTQTKRSSLISSPTMVMASMVKKLWQTEKKISIIPNPVDLDVMIEKNLKKTKSEEYLLYLGRIEKLKGVGILLKALKIVLKKSPHLKILFIGNSNLYDQNRLEKLSFKIKKNLIFLGDLEHSQVASYLKGAKLIILPSLRENCPYTMLESLALGKIVVASDCSGFREVIKDGENGFLFEVGSYRQLARKIREILILSEQKLKSISNNASNTAKKYNVLDISKQTLEFYTGLLLSNKKELEGIRQIPKQKLQNLLREGGIWGEGQYIDNAGREKIRDLIKQASAQGKIKVLDVGCGTGIEYEGYKKYNLRIDYTGLDAIEDVLIGGRKRNPEAKFYLGDAESLPFEDNSYDFVVARHLLEHLSNYEKALKELYRVSRKYIILDFFITPTDQKDDIKMHYFKIPGTFRWFKAYQNLYNKRRLIKFINKSGSVQKIDIFENLSNDNEYFDTVYFIIKK